MKRLARLATLTVVVMSLGCGGSGKVGDSLRPKDATGKDAMKEQSSLIKACKPAPGEPLVIDLKSNERSDFEIAMQEGVAVVSYNCKELHLLKSCSVHGASYGFKSVGIKEDIVQMASKDEVEANIPITGAKLSAGMQSGCTLELALITVGKKRVGAAHIHQGDLTGDCDGATHVVRGAYLGAFALGTGTVGQATAVAEMFGAGGGGSSVSKRKATTKDGDIEACRTAEPHASSPPAACQAITRLDLSPIKPGKNPNGSPGDAPPAVDPPTVDSDPNIEPAPPPSDAMSASASSSSGPSKSARSKGGKKPASKTPTKKGSASASAAPPPPPQGPSAAARNEAAAAAADAEETPSCPDGFKWNGVMCKKN